MPENSIVVEQVTEQIQRVNSRMAKVKHKVAVMSGKGGVGKSMVAANLAVAFALKGHSVGLIDADINGPAIPKMLGVLGDSLKMTPEGAFPVEGPLNIKIMSMDLLLSSSETPVIWDGPEQSEFVWRGALEKSAVREFLSDIQWGELDLLLFDLPPGTDQVLNLTQLLPDLAGVIMITIPSEISQHVVGKAVTFIRQKKVPLIGLIENMSHYICPKCGDEINLFGKNKLTNLKNVPILGKIPFDPRMEERGERGLHLLSEIKESLAGQSIMQIAEKVIKILKID